jgi:uncharacterized protein YutE (UPF0331/DUF86 family)
MDDVIAAKAASIRRCVKRAREEFKSAGDHFKTDFTHQDAAILNVVRACELAIDLANHVAQKRKLGLPATSRESFELLNAAGLIDDVLEDKLIRMVGFGNVAIHAYQRIDIEIVIRVIQHGLDDVLALADRMTTLDS